jgi:hypothetical protein
VPLVCAGCDPSHIPVQEINVVFAGPHNLGNLAFRFLGQNADFRQTLAIIAATVALSTPELSTM